LRFAKEDLLRPEQLCEITGWSPKTLANRRSQGKGPRYIKCGAKILYPRGDFEEFLEENLAPARSERKVALAVPSRRPAATKRNQNAALRNEYEARQKVLAGQGTSLKVKSMPFSEAAEKFIAWAESEYRKHPATARRLKVSMASCKTYFGEQPVRSITAGHVEDYKAWRRTAHGVRDVTLRHDLHALSTFYGGYAIKQQWARVNPVRDVDIPSDKDATRIHVLTAAEETAYLAAAERYANLYDLGRIMIRQGMRPEEVMTLEQANIDIEMETIFIPKGKSDAARRRLHLASDGEVARILQRRLDGGQWVFPGKKRGTHITKLNNSHGKVLEATGLRFVLYDLRHTFATRMAERGMDLATLAAILGHSGIRVVPRYIHISEGHQRDVMRRFGTEKTGSAMAVSWQADVN